MRNIFTILLLAFLVTSCQQPPVYSEFYSLPYQGWHQDSILSYDIQVLDSTASHEVLIVLRHTTQYPYQNLWLFVDEYAGGLLLHRDTIEAVLADDFGRWLGKGINRYELPLCYSASYRFIQQKNNRITIQQGMRTPILVGLTDIGVIIKQKDEQE